MLFHLRYVRSNNLTMVLLEWFWWKWSTRKFKNETKPISLLIYNRFGLRHHYWTNRHTPTKHDVEYLPQQFRWILRYIFLKNLWPSLASLVTTMAILTSGNIPHHTFPNIRCYVHHKKGTITLPKLTYYNISFPYTLHV